jgi:hypothetical protein
MRTKNVAFPGGEATFDFPAFAVKGRAEEWISIFRGISGWLLPVIGV